MEAALVSLRQDARCNRQAGNEAHATKRKTYEHFIGKTWGPVAASVALDAGLAGCASLAGGGGSELWCD